MLRHARGCADWERQTYWICTFSNNQWCINQELGQGCWQESSFYKARGRGKYFGNSGTNAPLHDIECLFYWQILFCRPCDGCAITAGLHLDFHLCNSPDRVSFLVH